MQILLFYGGAVSLGETLVYPGARKRKRRTTTSSSSHPRCPWQQPGQSSQRFTHSQHEGRRLTHSWLSFSCQLRLKFILKRDPFNFECQMC